MIMNNIYLLRDTEEFGPYARDTVIQMLAKQQFTPSDRYWYEGMTDWRPLAEFSVASARPAPQPKKSYPVREPQAAQPQAPAAAHDGRVPCPMCGERVMPSATLCPFCKQAIFSRDKSTNAVAGVVIFVILFLVLYYALTAFTHHEADKEYERISRDAEQQTKKIMRDFEAETDRLMRKYSNP